MNFLKTTHACPLLKIKVANLNPHKHFKKNNETLSKDNTTLPKYNFANCN